MALSQCAEDVLLGIASYIHHNPQRTSYDLDFEERRRIFRPLVLVCRRLNTVFTPLLYRTICLKHERNTWPAEYEKRWLQQNPHRRVMAALLRTLHEAPALGLYTYFLEVSWENHDDTSEDRQTVITYISMFPHLRGLHFFDPQRPHLGARDWGLHFLCSTSQSEALTELRMTQLFAASMLPTIFFLPNLHTLEVRVVDARNVDSWSIPSGARSRHSKVVHLFLTAMLTPDQLLQVLSWPAILRTFVYNHKGYPTPCAQAPTVSSFRAALQPFWRTLTTLTFTISGSCFISVKAINDDLQTTAQDNHDPYLDMSSFHILKDLQLPSHFLVGLPGKDYTRDHLLTLLPSSLQSLEIDFGPRDVFLSRDLHHRHWSLEMYYWASDRVDKHGWLYALQGQCHKNGQFPCLKKVVVSNYGRTEAWCQAYGLRQDFAKKGVQLHVALSNASVYGRNNDDDGYERDYDYGDNWYNDAPMFGQEPTEHSSSPRGTELLYHSDLDKHEEELLRMESWDGFDARMASERKRVEESWVRGQWPDYEESREERNETFRYTVRDGVYES